jgi:hypothetical protein
MGPAAKTVQAYEELAEWYDQQGLDQLRDRFLVLASDAALSAGTPDVAERIRGRLLRHNPQHLLKPYASLAEAMKTTDVQNYVSGLRRGYPPESVEGLLESMRAAKIGRETGTPEAVEDEAGTLHMPSALPPSRPPAKPPAKRADAPPVYAVKDEGQTKPEPARPRPVAPTHKPGTPGPSPGPSLRPLSPARPAPAPPKSNRTGSADVYSVLPDSGGPRRGRSREPDEVPQVYGGAWLPSALFVLLFVAGLALAVLTFAGPFLPEGWLR